MARYLLHRLALLALVSGGILAVAVPADKLNLCTRFSWMNCATGDIAYMRGAIVVLSALIALVLFAAGSLVGGPPTRAR